MRPPLRYHGGKWRLAPWIISHFQPHTTYTEVYGGGASVLIQKPRSYAEIYNDLDDQVVNFFRVLRNPLTADQLRQVCELTPYSRKEFNEAYDVTDDPVEQLPAVRVLQDHDTPQTLHYVDPPYTLDSRSERARRAPAYRHEMTNEQHCELATVLHSLRGMVILSGYRSPLYDDLYRDWHRVDKDAQSGQRTDRIESLWINPAAQGRMLFH
jgi:DNA adenine methylase